MKKDRRFWAALLIVWFILGSLAESFLPAVLTGNRVVDAILVSAVVTVLLAELAEVLWGVFLLLAGRSGKESA